MTLFLIILFTPAVLAIALIFAIGFVAAGEGE